MAQTDDMRVGAPSYFEPEVLDGTLVFRLGYDGAGFSGFAEQPGLRTVAGEVRCALETFLRRPIDSRVPVAPMQVFTP